MRRLFAVLIVVAVVCFAVFWFVTMPQSINTAALAPHQPNLENGETMFRAGGCSSCHASPEQPDATLLGGGRGLKSPFGTFFAPNISPDPKVGIGDWTEAQFVSAMVKGTAPDARHYFPVFPYPSYQYMQTGDVRDLFAYLKTLPSTQGETASPKPRDHDVPFPFNVRRFVGLWKLLFLDSHRFRPDA
jgi:mono/diheme cytochrome c family protein